MGKSILSFLSRISLALFFIAASTGACPSYALTWGKTYDKTNYQEVEKMIIPSMLNWVKKGEWVLTVKKLDYEPATYASVHNEATKNNVGKFDVLDDGTLVDKSTGKVANYYLGFPFLKIDIKNDPKAIMKIVANNYASHYRYGSNRDHARMVWIGTKGLERQMITRGLYLAYVNRMQGPIPNPQGFLQKQLSYVLEPFDLRGTVSMNWSLNDNRPDYTYAYVPALRRLRRVSAATKSDPYMGSDMTNDDLFGWGGKVQSATWKYLGEGTYLSPFLNDKIIPMRDNPDGSCSVTMVHPKMAYEEKGFAGVAPWCPIGMIYAPRDMYIFEATPKDPYYNAGKMIMYIDKKTYTITYKVTYDKSGQYWKTFIGSYPYEESPKGFTTGGMIMYNHVIDDKTHHSCMAEEYSYKGSEMVIQEPYVGGLNDSFFNDSAIKQYSK
jgi:hypothetical protein